MGILEKLGLGRPDPEIEKYAEEFLRKVKPGQGIVDIYGSNMARFRKISGRNPDGSYRENSFFVMRNPNGPGLLIFPEGIFTSDGK